MGILSGMQTRSAPPRDPVLAEWFGSGSRSSTGLSVTAETAMRVTAVYRCVMILAQTYASLPLAVYRDQDNGKQVDKTHPLYGLLHDQPNRWQTSFEWREMLQGHFALRGKAYSEIISSGGKGIAELVPLHPDRVTPFRAPDGKIAFQYQPPDGRSRVILQSEMHWLHGMTSDGITPLSPIALNREAVGLALAAEEHGAQLFGNGTRLGGVLKMAGHLKDQDARNNLLKSWREAYSGVRNVGKTALLEDGLEWQSLGMNAVDAQFIESRKLQVAEISRIFGVPLHKVSELDRSTYSNIEHQGIEFVTDTIRPGCVRWEQAMKRDLFYGSSRKTHYAEFNLDGLLRGDSNARARYFATARQWGWLNTDEIRAYENKNPLPDGKGQIYLEPLNMIEAGKQTEKLLDDKTPA